MIKVLIVGPKKSQHIQMWYEKADDLDLKFITADPGGKDFSRNVDEIAVGFKIRALRFLFLLPLVVYHYWKFKPDVVNFHYISSYGLLSLLIPKKRIILNIWGSDVNKYVKSNNKLHLYLIRRALKRFVWINAPAEHMKAKLIKLGARKDTIDVFQYGVPRLNRKYSMGDDVVRFLSNRNWDSLYQIDVILDAFIEFVNENPLNVELYVYGRGGVISKKLEQIFIQQPDLKTKIKVKGYVDHSTMLEEIRAMDVFLSVPNIDGMPLSLLEAMEIGLIPLVSPIDANYEWIKDGVNGFICEQVTINGLKKKLLEAYLAVIAKDDKVKQLIDFNRKLVQDKGRFELNVERFIDKIKDVSQI